MTHAQPPFEPHDHDLDHAVHPEGDAKLAELLRIEAQWLAMLREDRTYSDQDAFTERVVARWEAERVIGRIGRARSAAIVLAWAAMLALLVGISQTNWWQGVTIPETPSTNVHPVSALVQDASRRYDEQAMRVSRVLDEPVELITFDRVMELLIEPVARQANPGAANEK